MHIDTISIGLPLVFFKLNQNYDVSLLLDVVLI